LWAFEVGKDIAGLDKMPRQVGSAAAGRGGQLRAEREAALLLQTRRELLITEKQLRKKWPARSGSWKLKTAACATTWNSFGA
jgi:hypothetical protein